MTDEWTKRVLELRIRSAEKEDLEFVDLVDMAEDHCDFDTCKILMATFITEEDYGVQESVNRVMSTADPQDRQKALLEELPRLIVETPEWADSLLETEIRFYMDDLRKTVREISPELKKVLDRVLEKESFRKLFPELKL